MKLEGVLKSSGDFEGDLLTGGDLNLLTGSGAYTGSGGGLFDAEGAELIFSLYGYTYRVMGKVGGAQMF